MHFWQLFHPLFPTVPSPHSRYNPSVFLTLIPERSSSSPVHQTWISRILCGAGGSGRGGLDGVLVTDFVGIYRELVEDTLGWSTVSDDPYEKLMLLDLEIHPRAFDSGLQRCSPGFVRSVSQRWSGTRRSVHCDGAAKGYGGCLKRYTLSRAHRSTCRWHEKH